MEKWKLLSLLRAIDELVAPQTFPLPSSRLAKAQMPQQVFSFTCNSSQICLSLRPDRHQPNLALCERQYLILASEHLCTFAGPVGSCLPPVAASDKQIGRKLIGLRLRLMKTNTQQQARYANGTLGQSKQLAESIPRKRHWISLATPKCRINLALVGFVSLA